MTDAPTVTAAQVKAWRSALGLAQGAAAALAGMTRDKLAKVEGGKPAPPALVALVLGQPAAPAAAPPAPRQLSKPAKRTKRAGKGKSSTAPAVPVKGGKVTPNPALVGALARSPLYALTSAEASAMRCELARLRDCYPSEVRLIPLRPQWVRVGLGRKVNAAIPSPISEAAPDWSQPHGVLTASGAVYHYETAHLMSSPSAFGSAT